jgi:hypothetical protein
VRRAAPRRHHVWLLASQDGTAGSPFTTRRLRFVVGENP